MNLMQIYVVFRPFMLEFLREMKMYYELIIYSRMLSEYLNPILAFIEAKEGNVFSLKLDKSYCLENGGSYSKVMAILEKDRDSANILFIDSVFKEHLGHINNLVPLSQYTGPNSTDFELLKLQKFLKKAGEGSVPLRDTIKTRLAQVIH